MAKRGVNCLIDDDVVGAINMQKVLKTQLEKLAIAAKCFDATTKPFMTESEAIQFVYNNYAPKVVLFVVLFFSFTFDKQNFFSRTLKRLKNTLTILKF